MCLVSDILNRLHALFSSPACHDPAHDVRTQFERARHLAKYIFPCQYSLPHPFASLFADSAYNVTDADRELQIKALGSCKTPKRLHEALDLVEKIIWRHGKCAYKALLQKTCPSKVCSRSPG
ncbi:hypothetical protein PHLGIDRAFT_70705 [Phlebiopsis gigantea 11061_1 CR5-6]|uniref:Uncharacterized protein n=1 Tax=Phlebiopsis gigantea (strain 11061_1 CR5-6) TaxID=745531 RepID=A0A0C3RZ93_PHLG1|nr:hypothetical protein PHLGIDRAFT_70705 [Phlebiopsis gigantea 11061_1 CR5-6]